MISITISPLIPICIIHYIIKTHQSLYCKDTVRYALSTFGWNQAVLGPAAAIFYFQNSKILQDTTHYTMQVTQRNKKICNVRPLGYTPKSHRECLRSLKYSYFNVSRPHSNKNPDLIRHDINLIFYPNFILNYQYSDQISKKENRWNLVFSKASAIHFGCGRRTRTYDLRVMSGPETFL